MLRFTVLMLTIVSLTGSARLYAQDLLGSTASTSRSYSYVEVQYLPDLDADLPLLASALVAITDSVSVTGEYLKQGFTTGSNVFGTEIKFDGELLLIGLLYHKPLAAFVDSDWVAGLSIGRVEVEGTTTDGLFSAKVAQNVQEGYVGVRRSMSNTIEAEAGISAARQDGDIDFDGELRMVIRVRPSLDVALAINEIGDTDLFGIGFRYTW